MEMYIWLDKSIRVLVCNVELSFRFDRSCALCVLCRMEH